MKKEKIEKVNERKKDITGGGGGRVREKEKRQTDRESDREE